MSRWSLRYALLMVGAVACYSPPHHAEFTVGMTRAEVIGRFGEPERKDNLQKTDESVWGAIESFWSEVSMGSEVEIWFYATQVDVAGGDGSASVEGTTELYFVDGSDTVHGIGLAPNGAVFESDS
ncbi:MAG: hypothetical protein E4H37_04065 [Gemmatimonadales bacterium]|nr:MAG: hypothetical protein E4H37_04065 [Gemmatimonadales bacterium]